MADVIPFPFATVDDLKARWPDFPVGGEAHAEVLLEDASQYILDVCPSAGNAAEATRRRIVCAVVRRSMEQGLPSGVSSMSETAGGVSMQFSASNPTGDFYLTKQEKKSLGCGKQSAFGVQVAGGLGAQHQPWCNLAFGATYCSCGADLTGGYPLWEY
ncbi:MULTISPECIES: Gp19/Gp15/Gp42 family protein [Actinomycetes]|uniref:Gp19/Gp15/Gp42 family protein n=1 Tax=Actinomycetes TaxID=1760 RepID=UPI003412F737